MASPGILSKVMMQKPNDVKVNRISFRSGPIRVVLPPILTSTSYSVWLAAKKEARAERTEKMETSNMWLAPSPLRTAGETLASVSSSDDGNNENAGQSLAETVRRGLLRARESHSTVPVTITSSSPESLADQVRAGLMMAGAPSVISAPSPVTSDGWVVPEVRVSDDKEDMEEDDSSIVTLDTITDSSLSLEEFDVMEDTAPLLATWLAK